MKRIRLWNVTPPLYNEEFMKVDDNKISMSMDAYFIDDGEIHPAMIICPGGGYRYRNENEAGGVAGWLNTLGLSAFVLNYRVKPYDFPAPIIDGKRAIKFIRKFSGNMKIDPDRIGIMGFSSGAHLAALTAEVSDLKIAEMKDEIDDVSAEVNALGLCYPMISMSREYVDWEMKNFLTGGNEEIAKALSAELNARDGLCPTFIFDSFEEKNSHYRNGLDMLYALRETGNDVEYHIFKEGKNSMAMAEDIDGVKQWRSLFADWLRRIGF